MANVTLMGASYTDVPAVTLPQTGGGTVTFYENGGGAITIEDTPDAAGGTVRTITAIQVAGSQTITTNNTYDVTSLAQVIVNVAGSGGLVYESGTYTPASDTAQPTISFSQTHTKLPSFAMMVDSSGYTDTRYTNLQWVYYNWEQLVGSGIYTSSSAQIYGEIRFSYRATSTSSVSKSTATISYPESDTGASSSAYPRFSVTESNMYPYTGSPANYWKSGRNYKWIAVWMPTT